MPSIYDLIFVLNSQIIYNVIAGLAETGSVCRL